MKCKLWFISTFIIFLCLFNFSYIYAHEVDKNDISEITENKNDIKITGKELKLSKITNDISIRETTTETTTEHTTEITTEVITETTTEQITETTTEIFTDEKGIPLPENEQTVMRVFKNSNKSTKIPFRPEMKENISENELAKITQQDTIFQNGDYFWIRRYDFKTTDKNKNYSSSFSIPGNTIEIRYIKPDKTWAMTSNFENLPVTTLYINTDLYSAVVSVPANYKKDFTNNTLTVLKDLEKPIKITKLENEYNISFSFEQNNENIGEIWVLQSYNKIADWNNKTQFEVLLPHDLADERRWSLDGYYFITPHNYVPSGENVLYRHPANYTGASWAQYGDFLMAEDLGYIMTMVCTKNQNEEGFWATGPKSLWLESDFQIKERFYDTRFNTDFAVSLVRAYEKYNEPEFLKSAIRYAEFFLKHAEKNHYESKNGGWLVQDYAGKEPYVDTHVSLNHQLAEINFLYEIYKTTNEKRYLDMADIMLKAIEDTKDEWVLADNNLNYALMYTGTNNTMVDYPYLTYNDLYTTRRLLKSYFNRESETINYLMKCKKDWMDKNNVTGYIKDDVLDNVIISEPIVDDIILG